MNQCRQVLWACTVIIGVAVALDASAQQDATRQQLEEVVVTAQRRSEALQNVPISMTVVDGDQLERSGASRLEDIALVAPAVQLGRTGVYTQPTIRGITSTLAGNYENNVAVYVDGYYLPFTRGLNTDLVNISQVQVLKGPQGTLFGRNATGGAIMVQTLDPSPVDSEGRINVAYRRFGDRQAQGYFSTPATDTLAWNIAGAYRESDGYIEDIAGFDTAPMKNYSVATKLLWQPTDRFTLMGKYESLSVSDGRALALTFDGRSLVQRLFPETYLEARENRTSQNFPIDNTTYQHNSAAKIEYDLGWARLTSVTSYIRETNRLHYDLDGTARSIFEQRTRDRNTAWQQDLNLTSSAEGPVQYTAGVYYFESKLHTLLNLVLNGLSANPTAYVPSQSSTSRTQAYAGYAELTWQAMPRLFLTGGVRYSGETKELDVRDGTGAVIFPIAPRDNDESFSSWTPRAVVRYQLDDDSNVYASYSKGFKSGLINVAPPFNKIDPEKIDAYEVGYKIAANGWRLDSAVYYYDYQDLQVSSLQIIGNINSAVTTNAASAEIYGAEVQFSSSIADALNVGAGLAYTHARYKDFPQASQNGISNGLNTTTAAGCAVANPPCAADWHGKRLVRAPDVTGNVAADYTLDTSTGKFVFAGNASYSSAYNSAKGDLDANGNYRYEEDGYWLLNGRIAWSPASLEALTIAALGENLGDTRWYFYRSGNQFGDYHVLGRPRTWGISADFRF